MTTECKKGDQGRRYCDHCWGDHVTFLCNVDDSSEEERDESLSSISNDFHRIITSMFQRKYNYLHNMIQDLALSITSLRERLVAIEDSTLLGLNDQGSSAMLKDLKSEIVALRETQTTTTVSHFNMLKDLEKKTCQDKHDFELSQDGLKTRMDARELIVDEKFQQKAKREAMLTDAVNNHANVINNISSSLESAKSILRKRRRVDDCTLEELQEAIEERKRNKVVQTE